MKAIFHYLAQRLFPSDTPQPVPFPPPFKRMVAINSDVEWTSWKAQLDLIRCLSERELETAHSYWLFSCPKVTWRLFDENEQLTEFSDQAFHLMKNGGLDTLHSMGGRTHQSGCDFDRNSINKAYKALAKNGVRPLVYSNHGSTEDRQNVAGDWGTYQEGDLPGSDLYHLDLTRELGIKFFWCDPDYVNDQPVLAPSIDQENSIFVSGMGRDGTPYLRFRRFMGHDLGGGPSLDNLHVQMSQLLSGEHTGYTVIYQHFGVYRTPDSRPAEADTSRIPREALHALDNLKSAQDRGELLVTTTSRLLSHAALMTAQPWQITKSRGKIEVHFSRHFELAGVNFECTAEALEGWAIPASNYSVKAFIGGHPLPLSEFQCEGERYIGIPWERRNIGDILKGMTSSLNEDQAG